MLAWVPRRQELVHHTPQDQSSTPGHPSAVVTSTSTSYFKFANRATVLPQRPAGVRGRGGASHGGHAWCPRPRGRPRGRGVTNRKLPVHFCAARELCVFARPRLGCAAPPRARRPAARAHANGHARARHPSNPPAGGQGRHAHPHTNPAKRCKTRIFHWVHWWLRANGVRIGGAEAVRWVERTQLRLGL